MEFQLTEKEKKARDYVCLALDINDEGEILKAVEELWALVGYFKIHSGFTFFGPEIVKKIKQKGGRVFLDLKFHDIPNTVANYAEAVTKLGVNMFNLHVSGGSEMIKAAVKRAEETAEKTGKEKPKIIGMTILTSLNKDILNNETGMPGSVEDNVLRLAKIAKSSGCDGIVCSAKDLIDLKGKLSDDFFYVTPGINLSGAYEDQKRVVTPGEAVKAGSSLLVIGRAIYKAEDRKKAAYEILQDIAKVL